MGGGRGAHQVSTGDALVPRIIAQDCQAKETGVDVSSFITFDLTAIQSNISRPPSPPGLNRRVPIMHVFRPKGGEGFCRSG
jgi:hypothetical protein